RVGGRAQADRLPYRGVARAAAAHRRERRRIGGGHRTDESQRAGNAALDDRGGRVGRQLGKEGLHGGRRQCIIGTDGGETGGQQARTLTLALDRVLLGHGVEGALDVGFVGDADV